MRRFQFRLETVLRHREIIETLREQEFTEANGVLQVLLRRIETLQSEFRKTVAERPGSVPGQPFDAGSIFDRERYLETLQASLAREERKAEAARVVMEEKRQALVAARQATQAVSRLREKDFADYQAEAQRIAQQALDEMAGLRHIRAQRSESEV